MVLNRPDLTGLDDQIYQYILALEAELKRLEGQSRKPRLSKAEEKEVEPPAEERFEQAEQPTTIQLITATAGGVGKRTARHLYHRQRRGGMGIFDLDAPEGDPSAILAMADERKNLILITSHGRGFRLPVSALSAGEVRSRGSTFAAKFNLPAEEKLAVILPEEAEGYVALLSKRGHVRMLRHHVFGEHMKPGAQLFEYRTFGPLAAACWTRGGADLFIASRSGRAIRFADRNIPPAGCLGLRLAEGDEAVGICQVTEESAVLLITADGKAARRLMSTFSANKAPGAGGKIAMQTDQLVWAACADDVTDLFLLSSLSKVIRFAADEIPAKDGPVQGVIAMNLRNDRVVAACASPSTPF